MSEWSDFPRYLKGHTRAVLRLANFAASINHKVLDLGQFLDSHCIVRGFKLKSGSVCIKESSKEKFSWDAPGLVLVTPLTLAHPSASQSPDRCQSPPPFCSFDPSTSSSANTTLRITSWCVVVTVVHPLGAPALLPRLWSAVGSHAATHESETRARLSCSCRHLPRPTYLDPHITTITFHIPNPLLRQPRSTLHDPKS